MHRCHSDIREVQGVSGLHANLKSSVLVADRSAVCSTNNDAYALQRSLPVYYGTRYDEGVAFLRVGQVSRMSLQHGQRSVEQSGHLLGHRARVIGYEQQQRQG